MDGVVHNNEREARAYCERKIGPIITAHAHRLVHLEKYSQIISYLEENLQDFATAAQWQTESREKLQDGDDD